MKQILVHSIVARLGLLTLTLATGLPPSALVSASPLGTAFTYQGRLNDGGQPASGAYDLRFAVFDAAQDGNGVGGVRTNAATPVVKGLFTVMLDFGPGVFTGEARWLEIAVRTNVVGDFVILTPRQPITPTPYAMHARSVSAPLTLIAEAAPGTAVLGVGTTGDGVAIGASNTNGEIAVLGKTDTAVWGLSPRGFAGYFDGKGFFSGNVGIGTSQPQSALHVAGTVTAEAFSGSGAGLSGISSAALSDGSVTGSKIAPGAVTTAALANGAVDNAQLMDGAVTALKLASVTNFNLLTTFTNPTPIFRDYFGGAMAAVGSDRVLIGDDLNGFAYLFRLNGTLLSTFNNPTPVFDGDGFGTSLSAVGNDRVLIGAHLDDAGAANSGAAYLFSTNGTLLTTFTNPTPAASDYFGFSVAALGSDGVLIGAYHDGTGAYAAGAAYLFSTNGTLLTTFTNPTPAFGDSFGYSVAAVGNDRVLIGAYLDDAGADNSGAAYLFSTNGTMLTTFTNPAPALGGSFGISVAAVGSERVLIGANSANAAYLFTTNGALLATFANPTPASLDLFGLSVAALGSDRVLIAAKGDDTGATDAGAVYLFSIDGSLLATFTGPTPQAGGNFGVAVSSIGSDRVLIGGFTNGGNNGAAHLYVPETYARGLIAEGVRQGAITTDSLAEHAVTQAKLAPGAVTSNSIASGQVVRRLNGLSDVVTLTAGPNVTITPSGNTLQIAAVASTNGVAAWGLTGNTNTLPGVNFLGTTDNQPLEFKVNGQRALRLQPATHSPNVIGGYSGNSIGSGVIGGSIAGGGSPRILPLFTSFPNAVNADFGSVLGGRGNTVNGFAGTVAGGQQNVANGYASFAAGTGANALHEGSFVWSDTSGGDFPSTTNNQFLIRASGGVGIGTNNPQAALDVAGNVKANGNLIVTGDLQVSGAYKGSIGPHWGAPFPRPAYDSGWVSISQDEGITLNHNIGGNADNYVVDMQFKNSSGYVNVHGFGGYWAGVGAGSRGAWWSGLTSSAIYIKREDGELNIDFIRIRIWVYN